MPALLFTTGSPFARSIRVILDELGLDYERREEITTPTVQERANATPTLQVPTRAGADVGFRTFRVPLIPQLRS